MPESTEATFVPAKKDCEEGQTNFKVMVGESITVDREDRYFGLVQSLDEKPGRRLHDVV